MAGGGTSGYIYEAVRETTVVARGVAVVGVSLFFLLLLNVVIYTCAWG